MSRLKTSLIIVRDVKSAFVECELDLIRGGINHFVVFVAVVDVVSQGKETSQPNERATLLVQLDEFTVSSCGT